MKNSEKLTERVCRSAVCGGDAFIPDSEYQGGSCNISISAEIPDISPEQTYEEKE